MGIIQHGDRLPPFPFKVVCVDNERREDYLVVGQTYTVVGHHDESHYNIASSDFILQGVEVSCAIRRFKMAPAEPPDISDWRTWRDHGLEPGHCVCRIPKEKCDFHRHQT